MNNRHVFRDLMTRYPANDRQERRQMLFLMTALAALALVMMAALFA
jgi:hypothetical protein